VRMQTDDDDGLPLPDCDTLQEGTSPAYVSELRLIHSVEHRKQQSKDATYAFPEWAVVGMPEAFQEAMLQLDTGVRHALFQYGLPPDITTADHMYTVLRDVVMDLRLLSRDRSLVLQLCELVCGGPDGRKPKCTMARLRGATLACADDGLLGVAIASIRQYLCAAWQAFAEELMSYRSGRNETGRPPLLQATSPARVRAVLLGATKPLGTRAPLGKQLLGFLISVLGRSRDGPGDPEGDTAHAREAAHALNAMLVRAYGQELVEPSASIDVLDLPHLASEEARIAAVADILACTPAEAREATPSLSLGLKSPSPLCTVLLVNRLLPGLPELAGVAGSVLRPSKATEGCAHRGMKIRALLRDTLWLAHAAPGGRVPLWAMDTVVKRHRARDPRTGIFDLLPTAILRALSLLFVNWPVGTTAAWDASVALMITNMVCQQHPCEQTGAPSHHELAAAAISREHAVAGDGASLSLSMEPLVSHALRDAGCCSDAVWDPKTALQHYFGGSSALTTHFLDRSGALEACIIFDSAEVDPTRRTSTLPAMGGHPDCRLTWIGFGMPTPVAVAAKLRGLVAWDSSAGEVLVTDDALVEVLAVGLVWNAAKSIRRGSHAPREGPPDQGHPGCGCVAVGRAAAPRVSSPTTSSGIDGASDALPNTRKKRRLDPAPPTCIACGGDSTVPTIPTTCPHAMCTACAVILVENRIASLAVGNGEYADMCGMEVWKCADPLCAAGSLETAAAAHLSADFQHLHQGLTAGRERAASARDGTRACATCWGQVTPCPEEGVVATCAVCQMRTCTQCGRSAHPGVLCPARERRNAATDPETVLNDAKLQRCPGCAVQTTKALGCNHIVCSACHTPWCWHCSGKIETVTGHYSEGGQCSGTMLSYTCDSERARMAAAIRARPDLTDAVKAEALSMLASTFRQTQADL